MRWGIVGVVFLALAYGLAMIKNNLYASKKANESIVEVFDERDLGSYPETDELSEEGIIHQFDQKPPSKIDDDYVGFDNFISELCDTRDCKID